jgi:quinol monooxygenase YgiN
MILAIIEMKARPAKRKELLQTLHAIIQQIRNEKGCTKCSACQDIENENIFSLIEEWTTPQDIDNHYGRFLMDDLHLWPFHASLR